MTGRVVWTFPVAALDPRRPASLAAQIARAVSEDARRGRLRVGDPLPGSRTLATTLGVHRNTVLSAYRELQAEGWLRRDGQRLCVAPDLPRPVVARGVGDRDGVGFDWPGEGQTYAVEVEGHPPAKASRRGLLRLEGGVPDLRWLPMTELARALRRELRGAGTRGALLGYGDPRGLPRLREAVATMLREARGLSCGGRDVLLTAGSQMGLDLLARSLVEPGDVVAVEDPGYAPAWRAFRQAGAEIVPVPVDGRGLCIEALEEVASARRLRAVYTTPHHQYPTTVTLGAARRLKLLQLARARRFAIVEDDYDFEFHYEGRPVVPLAAMDDAGVVLYVGTFSKVLAPGLRQGFVVAPGPVLGHLARLRAAMDRHGSPLVEGALAELLEEGLLHRHVRKMRALYLRRRDVLVAALQRSLGHVLSVTAPPGGMSLWATTASGVDAAAWARRGLAAGVSFHAGARFAFEPRAIPAIRVGFTALGEGDLEEAVVRMVRALPVAYRPCR